MLLTANRKVTLTEERDFEWPECARVHVLWCFIISTYCIIIASHNPSWKLQVQSSTIYTRFLLSKQWTILGNSRHLHNKISKLYLIRHYYVMKPKGCFWMFCSWLALYVIFSILCRQRINWMPLMPNTNLLLTVVFCLFSLSSILLKKLAWSLLP